MKPESLEGFTVPGCTVVNLAYLGDGSRRENLTAIENLAEASARAKVRRFIHCSTAVITGRVPDDVIDEETKHNPKSEYEKTKLEVEKTLLGRYGNLFELVILRPTAVFGPGGKNLLKLARDLREGNWIINYLKSCIFGYRRMNLVYIDNVVSSIAFLMDSQKRMSREIFIISDDEYESNNYRDVEQFLMKKLGIRDYPLPRFSLPSFVLAFLLKLAGKSNLNPAATYDCQKLLRTGFNKRVPFHEGLASFADWYRDEFCRTQESTGS